MNPRLRGVAITLCAFLLAGCTSDLSGSGGKADVEAQVEPPQTWVVPALSNMRLDRAQARLAKIAPDGKLRFLDLSPRRRNVGGAEHWIAVHTVPRAGSSLEVGEEAVVFALRDREYRWLKRHPRMPKIRPGYESYEEDDGFGDEFLRYHDGLSAIRELVLIRYPRDYKTHRAKRIRSVPNYRPLRPYDPSLEPPRERNPRRGLLAPKKHADVRETGVTWPKRGVRLRLGQLFIYYVKDEKKESAREYAEMMAEIENDYYIDTDDDDDDFNVPGWLCPTRYC